MLRRVYIPAVLTVLTVLLAAGCSSDHVMSDERFAAILADLYLVNVYCDSENIECDSLDIYTPVLESHGEDLNGFVRKFSSFSRRKSAKVSNIINVVYRRLDQLAQTSMSQMRIRSDVSQDIIDRATDTMYLHASQITVSEPSDTMRMRLSLPLRSGTYDLTMSYDLEKRSDDQTVTLGMGTIGNSAPVSSRYVLREGENNLAVMSLSVRDALADSIYVSLFSLEKSAGRGLPQFACRNISVIYIPTPEAARDWVMQTEYAYDPVYRIGGGKTLSNHVTRPYDAWRGPLRVADGQLNDNVNN